MVSVGVAGLVGAMKSVLAVVSSVSTLSMTVTGSVAPSVMVPAVGSAAMVTGVSITVTLTDSERTSLALSLTLMVRTIVAPTVSGTVHSVAGTGWSVVMVTAGPPLDAVHSYLSVSPASVSLAEPFSDTTVPRPTCIPSVGAVILTLRGASLAPVMTISISAVTLGRAMYPTV